MEGTLPGDLGRKSPPTPKATPRCWQRKASSPAEEKEETGALLTGQFLFYPRIFWFPLAFAWAVVLLFLFFNRNLVPAGFPYQCVLL